MEPLVVETQLEFNDWRALQYYVQRRLVANQSRSSKIVQWLIAIAVAVAIASLGKLTRGNAFVAGTMSGAILAVAGYAILMIVRARALRPKPDGPMFAPFRVQFDATGFRSERAGQRSLSDWRTVSDITEGPEHVFFALDRATALVIPKRALTSVPPATFVSQVIAWHAAYVRPTAPAEPPPESVPAEPPPLPAWMLTKSPPRIEQPPFWPSLKTNLRGGIKTLLARKIGPTDFVTTFDQVVALIIVVLALSSLLDWQRAPASPTFDTDGFYSWALWLGLGVVVSALIARSYSAATDTRKVLIAMLAVAPWAVTLLWALQKIPGLAEDDDTFSVVMIATFIVFGFQLVRATAGYVTLSAYVIVILASLLLGRIDQYVWLDTHTWRVASSESDSHDSYDDWGSTESLYFNEPERIVEAADAMAPERPGTTDIYYVGFAGDGSQRVFRREALFGQQIFADRMGSGSRSLELINDEDDRIAYPLGTMSGLHYALALIGKRMDTSDDIVVLFLTSHGSQDDGVSVQNGGLPLNDIEPEQIRRALDAAGIRWRIVIVSACYSGIFVDPLKDENTVVITAADEDHTSFGCADDRDLTYFGEAFLRDALPKANSLEAAFKAARASIGEREKAENLTPSNPQLYVGPEIRKKLESLGPLPLAR